jgi:phosphatidylserine/phosphatidylglycerophosphate/cardiolipin synthase-like enzyme
MDSNRGNQYPTIIERGRMTEFVSDRQIFERVIRDLVPQVERQLWIATADIKDMYTEHPGKGRKMIPFLEVLADLIARGVEVRLIHAKEPGPAFREDFDKYPLLIDGLERMLCPRVHFKCVICDSKIAYLGSANLTGAGMGAKSVKRRNFENGVLTDSSALLAPLIEQFDAVWRGDYCADCDRKEHCNDCPMV